MSRVAKNPISIPKGVEVSLNGRDITVKGPLGSLSRTVADGVAFEVAESQLVCRKPDGGAPVGAMAGTMRALVANMVMGVSEGFTKRLQLVGVGYRAQAQGDTLNLTLGFSHPVAHKMPAGIRVETPTQTEVVLKGIDRQLVGQVAAEVRAYRPPEPYKGKGVRYVGEKVVIKETKKK